MLNVQEARIAHDIQEMATETQEHLCGLTHSARQRISHTVTCMGYVARFARYLWKNKHHRPLKETRLLLERLYMWPVLSVIPQH